jgi:4-amino-4-deoxy-L-arabinose transferase-like glycosyltransferase
MSHDALTEARSISALKQRARPTHIILVALCLLTLGTRVGYAFITPIDAAHDEWDHIATNLARDQGYVSSWPKTYIQPAYLNIPNYQFPLLPTATRVPVPVFYFALMYRLLGLDDRSLVIGQWILDTLTCLVLFALALRVFGDRRVAILTSVAWALYPPALWLSNSRFSEPMMTLLLACLVYLLVWSQETHQARRYALAGVMWGLCILTRPILIVLPLFFFPVLIVQLRRQLRRAVLAGMALALGGAIVLAPWVYRNYLVFHAFIPTSTISGLNLFRENYLLDHDDYLTFRNIPIFQQTSKEMFDRRFGSVAVVETADDTQLLIDRTYRDEAIAKILEYPGRYIILSLVRVLRLWFNVGYGDPPSLASYLILIGHLVLIALTVKAFASYRGDWMFKLVPAFVLIVQHTLTYMAIVGAFRYSVPLMPYLFMTGSYALVRLLEGRGIRHGDRAHVQEWREEH